MAIDIENTKIKTYKFKYNFSDFQKKKKNKSIFNSRKNGNTISEWLYDFNLLQIGKA